MYLLIVIITAFYTSSARNNNNNNTSINCVSHKTLNYHRHHHSCNWRLKKKKIFNVIVSLRRLVRRATTDHRYTNRPARCTSCGRTPRTHVKHEPTLYFIILW